VAIWFSVPSCYLFADFLHALMTKRARDAELVLRGVMGQKVDGGLPRQVVEQRVIGAGDSTS